MDIVLVSFRVTSSADCLYSTVISILEVEKTLGSDEKIKKWAETDGQEEVLLSLTSNVE